MIITYHGVGCLKVQFGDTVIAANPISKESKEKAPKFGADIALISLQDKDHNGAENAAHGDRNPFTVSGPGEYEIKGVFIRGFPETSAYGGADRINTIYRVTLEGMNLCFLGALSGTDLKTETVGGLDDIDVLFVPVGAKGVLTAADANKIAVKLESKIIIPTHYDPASLKTFLKEAGSESVSPVDKITLKKKDLEGKEGEIMVLSAQG